jgi:hypothetical protein
MVQPTLYYHKRFRAGEQVEASSFDDEPSVKFEEATQVVKLNAKVLRDLVSSKM